MTKNNIEFINTRIKNEVCYNTIEKLKDENLIEEYKTCKSVINEIGKLECILNKYNIDDKKNKFYY